MKLTWRLAAVVIVTLFAALVVGAQALAPSAITGDEFLINVTSGTSPLPSSGYSIFLPANSGNAIQLISIYNGLGDAGTYTYTQKNSTNGQLAVSDSVNGLQATVNLSFTAQNQGAYSLASTFPSGYSQAGIFTSAMGTAPVSLAGKVIQGGTTDGMAPYVTSTAFNLIFAQTGNTYVLNSIDLPGRGMGIQSSGTYSNALLNRSTMAVYLNDSLSGTNVMYISFATAISGQFAIAQSTSSGGFEIGSFTASDNTPPRVVITSPTAGQRWSNVVFTVTGKAGDDVGVAAVYCRVGAQDWTLATSANGGTNWTCNVNLSPGTNIVQAYAVDTSANASAVTNQSVYYVVLAPVTFLTNGSGTLSPNYIGASLELGRNYSVTAAAGAGFRFANWTGSIATNAATLNFTMASNLTFTANFADATPPRLNFSNLVAGQRWSNAVFTVKGGATDNVAVASVQYQLNGGDWTNATGTKSWSAVLALVPGTNSFAAYAVDAAGNVSVTNAVNFQYVVTNQLLIRKTGLGSVSPDDNNAWLEIGRNYSITSAPAAGFVFTNWVISTNWVGNFTKGKTNLVFLMQSNLTLQANFIDVTPPLLTFTQPVAGAHVLKALVSLKGTATDNWQVSNVWYQLNGTAWNSATTTNGWTNWGTTLQLVAGTNKVNAYAVDIGGNSSLTNSLSFYSSNTFLLKMNFATASPLLSNGLNFNLLVSTGLAGHIEYSTNLLNWSTLTNFTGSNGVIKFRDAAATNFYQRFYRAAIP
ncbi:MAG TPA: Ig-like domain-containing protein [Verrucomicrobiae bacterium]|nr:Ig-like domain-containing protein [Verrucomicrobiae bacterium]